MTTIEIHWSGSHPRSLPALVLDFIGEQWRELGLEAMAVCFEMIAADCRHNKWYLDVVKKADLSDDQFFETLERTEEAILLAKGAMQAFAIDPQRDKLLATFREVTDRLNDRSLPPARP
jgi:hypothetical protein